MSWKVAKISRYSTLGTISDYIDDVNGFLIRVGFRDPGNGDIILDTKFRSFVANLRPYFGKIKIGYYFTSQAITEEEAVEEAYFVQDAIEGYQNDFPVFFDVDLGNIAGTGRADQLDPETRYQLYQAFHGIVDNTGILLDYSFQTLIDVAESDELGAVIIRKYSDIHPEIHGVEIDGWEYASNDFTIEGASNVCPILVYNDIAGWESSAKPIEDYINELESYSFVYTGSQIKPAVKNPYELIEGIDYNVFYSYNVNVNEENTINQPTVTVYGLNSYSGTSVMHFSILPKTLSGDVIVKPSAAAYTGNPIRPSVSIKGLNNNTDYIVRFQDNVAVGNYLITIIGRRNYTGTLTAKFTITPLEVTSDMFSIPLPYYPYTGYQIKPEVIVNNSIVGDQYADMDDGRFDYGDVGDPDYQPDYDLVDYNGGDESDEEKVQWLGDYDFMNMLSNYDIEYGNNVNIGEKTGSVTINGINNFIGQLVLFFDIVKDSFDGEFELEETEFVYNEKEHCPKVINIGGGLDDDGRFDYEDEESEVLVDVDGGDETSEDIPQYLDDYDFDNMGSLIEGIHYTVEYENNIAVGIGTAIITGIYPYIATTTLQFSITPVDINSDVYEWWLERTSYKFTSEPIEPVVMFRKSNEAIGEDPTFDTTYKDNTRFGIGTVIINGNGNFTGSKEFKFGIVAGDLSTDCICRCGEPDEDGLYDFNSFEVYDVTRNRKLIPYEDYYFDNDSYYIVYPYNPSYIRVYRKVTGYYNYTGELESIFPTRLEGIPATVPRINGISVEVIFMNGGEIPEQDQPDDPEPEVVVPDYDPWEEETKDDKEDPSGHPEGWIPTENLFPVEKDITEDADPTLIDTFPPGTVMKLYNCKYYSSPENIYAELDTLTGSFYIYNYHVVEDRIRITRTRDQINLPGRNTGWIDTADLYLNLDGVTFKVGDYVYVLKDIYRNVDGSGGMIAKAGEYMYITAIATALAWDFGNQDIFPFQTDTSNTDYDFVTLAGDEDEDDYGPKPDPEPDPEEPDEGDGEEENISVIYVGLGDYDPTDDDDSPYDFLRMAREAGGENGYIIGLSTLKNQVPIGWASTEMIVRAEDIQV